MAFNIKLSSLFKKKIAHGTAFTHTCTLDVAKDLEPWSRRGMRWPSGRQREKENGRGASVAGCGQGRHEWMAEPEPPREDSRDAGHEVVRVAWGAVSVLLGCSRSRLACLGLMFLGSFSSWVARAGLARYSKEAKMSARAGSLGYRAELSRASIKSSELTSYKLFVQLYIQVTGYRMIYSDCIFLSTQACMILIWGDHTTILISFLMLQIKILFNMGWQCVR